MSRTSSRRNSLPPMPESEVLSQCLHYLSLTDIFAWRNNTGSLPTGQRRVRFGLPGSSDILGVLPDGRMIAIECKRPGGRVTLAQRAFLQRVGEQGGLALVVSSVDGLRLALRAEGYDVP